MARRQLEMFGMILDGRAQESGIKRRGSVATLLRIYNAQYDVVNSTIPSVARGQNWIGLIDTNEPDAQLPIPAFGHVHAVTGRSLVALGWPPRINAGFDRAWGQSSMHPTCEWGR
jgi:isoamylase